VWGSRMARQSLLHRIAVAPDCRLRRHDAMIFSGVVSIPFGSMEA